MIYWTASGILVVSSFSWLFLSLFFFFAPAASTCFDWLLHKNYKLPSCLVSLLWWAIFDGRSTATSAHANNENWLLSVSRKGARERNMRSFLRAHFANTIRYAAFSRSLPSSRCAICVLLQGWSEAKKSRKKSETERDSCTAVENGLIFFSMAVKKKEDVGRREEKWRAASWRKLSKQLI